MASVNPGYGGRTALPPILSECFRPVAISPPPKCVIYEVLFYQSGFHQGRKLSLVLDSVLSACPRVLSQRSQYDFGIRAAKRIVMNAADRRREQAEVSIDPTQKSEEEALQGAIDHVLASLVIKSDLIAFRGVLDAHFSQEQETDLQTPAPMIAAQISIAASQSTYFKTSTIISALESHYTLEHLDPCSEIVDRVASLCTPWKPKTNPLVFP